MPWGRGRPRAPRDELPCACMESAFTRVAVVQLEHHPARIASFRSPLEDPGGATPLLPVSADISPDMRGHFEKLRWRVREAYCRQLLARLDRILRVCRSWEVKILVLPEYSVPWDILEPLAHAAGPMVVVAGSHYVERVALRCGLYKHLGCAEDDLPKPGQAVAPILHDGRILALVAKLHADLAEHEELEPGKAWRPIPMPEGLPGPMGVLIGLDFLHRESPRYRQLVADQLSECRFLAVPSCTSPASLAEVHARAWDEARRYGRPVLYADHADGGGTAFFVDEERRSDLRPYPARPGCLHSREEGILVADIDMGYRRPGGSTRHATTRPVRPLAAASLVYEARPLEKEYADWLDGLLRIVDFDRCTQLDEALAYVDEHRPLLCRVRDAAPPTRRERLDRLLDETRFISSTVTLEQLVCEVLLHASVLPMSALRAAHVEAAKEAVVHWLARSPALGRATVGLLGEASQLQTPALEPEAQQQVEQEKRAVRGRVQGNASPQKYWGQNLVVQSGVSLAVRRHARDLEMRMSPAKAATFLGGEVDPDLPRSEHTPDDDAIDAINGQINVAYAQSAVAFSDLLAAEGGEPSAAIAVSRIYMMSTNGMILRRGRGITFERGKIFLLARRGAAWRLATYEPTFRISHPVTGAVEVPEEPLYPPLDEESRQPIIDAFEEWGIDVEGINVVGSEEIDRRFDAILGRFDGARETVRELRQRRLAEVGGHFVEPSLVHERRSSDGWRVRTDAVVEPALSALTAWLDMGRGGTDHPSGAAILLGEYGSGKSTLLAEWALRCWEAPEGPRPLLVESRGLLRGGAAGLVAHGRAARRHAREPRGASLGDPVWQALSCLRRLRRDGDPRHDRRATPEARRSVRYRTVRRPRHPVVAGSLLSDRGGDEERARSRAHGFHLHLWTRAPLQHVLLLGAAGALAPARSDGGRGDGGHAVAANAGDLQPRRAMPATHPARHDHRGAA